ncbi:MAG: mechanosensitive ion channel family protein [Bergeyella sp.]
MTSDTIKEESVQYIDLVWRTLDKWYEQFAEMTPRLIVGIIVFLLFFAFSNYLSKIAVKLFHRIFPKSAQQNSLNTLISIFRFLILILGAFIALEIMGLNGFLWKFIGSLGVAGVIAGVALKDLVSSIFSGMLVGIDKAFKTGDHITIGSHSGKVQEIGFLTTKLITEDGKKIYIPNQVIFSAPFYNITASPQKKVIIDFEIPMGEDISKARNSMLDEIKKLKNTDKTDEAKVIFTDVKQGFFTIQASFWIEKEENFSLIKSDAIMKINERLTTDGIRLDTPTNIQISPPEIPKNQ